MKLQFQVLKILFVIKYIFGGLQLKNVVKAANFFKSGYFILFVIGTTAGWSLVNTHILPELFYMFLKVRFERVYIISVNFYTKSISDFVIE